jgi:hypothetical protein
MRGGEQLSIPVHRHPSERWIGIYVTIASSQTIFMVLDTGSPQSTISSGVAHDLHRRNLLVPADDHSSYHLTNLTAPPHSLPDLTVRVFPRLARLQIDGLLGLDFFNHFELTCFRVSSMQLLLEYPASS